MSKGVVYLLLGPETGEKELFIDGIRKRIVEQTGSSPEESRFYPYDSSMTDLVSSMKTGSLFGGYRITFLNSAHEVKKKGEIALLAEYCRAPAPDTTLFIVSDEISVDPVLKKAVPEDRTRVFWELYENQKQSWIVSFFKGRKMGIAAEAVDLLLLLVENNTAELRSACESLARFYGEGHIVSETDIDEYICHSREETVFSLFGKIMERDLAASLEILQKLMLSADSSAVQILSGILWQLRRLILVKTLVSRNYSIQEACQKADVRSKRQQKEYGAGTKNYTEAELLRIQNLAADYDIALRSMRGDFQLILLQLFLYKAQSTDRLTSLWPAPVR